MVGKTVRCSGCSTEFIVPGLPALSLPARTCVESPPTSHAITTQKVLPTKNEGITRLPTELADRDISVNSPFGLEGWRKVNLGLRLMWMGMLSLVICAIFGGLLNEVIGDILQGTIQVTAAVPILAGMVLCTWVPEPQSRGFMLGALLCLASVLLVFVGAMSGFFSGMTSIAIMASMIPSIMLVGMVVFVVLFLRNVARHCAVFHVARSCHSFLRLQAYTVLSVLGIIAVMAVVSLLDSGTARGGESVGVFFALVAMGVFPCVLSIVALVSFVWFISLLVQTQSALQGELRRWRLLADEASQSSS